MSSSSSTTVSSTETTTKKFPLWATISLITVGIVVLVGIALFIWWLVAKNGPKTPSSPPPSETTPTTTPKPIPPRTTPIYPLPNTAGISTALVAQNGYYTDAESGNCIKALAENAVAWSLINNSGCTIYPTIKGAGDSTCPQNYWGTGTVVGPNSTVNWRDSLDGGLYFTFYTECRVALESSSGCLSFNTFPLSPTINPSTDYIEITIDRSGSVSRKVISLS